MSKKDLENEIIDSLDEQEEIKVDDKLKGKVNHPLSPDFLKAVIQNRNTTVLNATVDSYDPHSVAIALSELEPEDLLFFFRTVNPDASAEVFTLLDQDYREKVVEAFSSDELQGIVEEMQTDNLVDFVDELPANLVTKVLRASNKENRRRIDSYLRFKEDSAGTLMTPEYLSVKDNSTVEEAIKKIRRIGKDMETIWAIFVVDSTRRLIGTVRLDTLLESDSTDIIRSIMNDDFISVTTSTDQEVVFKAFRKYDISVLPVTNQQQRMLGIITFDDVIDVANEENTEDIELSSGVIPSETPYLKRSPLELVKSYAIWLVILLFLDTFISMTLSYLQQPIQNLILIAFLPAVMGTNSNAADQTTTVVIREIALGNISKANYFKALKKELQSALITGCILGAFGFAWTLLELYTGMVTISVGDQSVLANFYNGNTNLYYISIAGVIALSFIVSIVIAKWLGLTIPLLAKFFHIDPAVMSQPLISTILDILSIIIFLLFSILIIQGITL